MSEVFFGVEAIIGPVSQGRRTSKTALKKDATLPNKQGTFILGWRDRLTHIGNHKQNLDPSKSCFKQQSNQVYTSS